MQMQSLKGGSHTFFGINLIMSKFETAVKIFKMIDKDNSGFITADEVSK